MKLSKDFELWEFTTSQTASRFKIDNQPNSQAIANLTLLCKTILQPAREALGPLRISSGYRCPELNLRIGGSPTSAHKLGFAADVIPIHCSKLAFAKWVAANCLFDQLILEFGSLGEPAWIHVANEPRNRKQILRILPGTGYVSVKL